MVLSFRVFRGKPLSRSDFRFTATDAGFTVPLAVSVFPPMIAKGVMIFFFFGYKESGGIEFWGSRMVAVNFHAHFLGKMEDKKTREKQQRDLAR